jgi:hypothetical protein
MLRQERPVGQCDDAAGAELVTKGILRFAWLARIGFGHAAQREKKARWKPCHPPIQVKACYDFFATSSLFWTVKAPNTWPARMPAICLSIALPTTP